MKRSAVVTGAARGIGLAIARAFSEAGWEVLGVDVAEPPEAPGIEFARVDLAEPDQIEAYFAELAASREGLDVLVNDAAVQLAKPLVETTADEWDAVMAVNLRGASLAVRGALGLLAAARGSVVNISSVHAVATSPGMSAYVASKGALLALTRALALELAADGVRVNAVLPGAIHTEMLEEGLCRGHLGARGTAAALEALRARHPLGRIGAPEDVAEAVLFLADSTKAGFITGQGLIVDGGATARLSTE